jgi:trans-aconitate methyltransferase
VHRWLKQHPTLMRDAVRRLMARGILSRAVGAEFRRAWYVLILDRWFTAFG